MNVLDRLHGHRARFLTLTLRSHHQSLTELLDKLNACFTRLRTRPLWRKAVTGGVSFIEVKWNDELQRWNVHLHAIIQGTYMHQALLSKLWKRITGDSLIVDIRAVRDNAHVTRYVTKYASKPLSHTVVLDPDRLDEAIHALKGRRLATTLGDWRGVLLTPKQDEESWENLGYLDVMYRDASAGNAFAISVLSSLNAPDAPTTDVIPMTRAPPASSTQQPPQPNLDFHPTTTTYDQADCLRR
jgi:hypothetical protein